MLFWNAELERDAHNQLTLHPERVLKLLIKEGEFHTSANNHAKSKSQEDLVQMKCSENKMKPKRFH